MVCIVVLIILQHQLLLESLGNDMLEFLIATFYYSIVKAVVAHESALRAQAKKMNVDSLRSGGKDSEESAEVKIAKVAITNVLLWFCIWTPYAAVCSLPILGYQTALTPLVSQIPSFGG